MANPIAADPNSDEFKEVHSIMSGILAGLAITGRYPINLIIEATDEAVTDFEDGMVKALARADGRE